MIIDQPNILENKRPKIFEDCKFRIGMICQCPEKGTIFIISSILYFHPDSPTHFVLNGITTDGKQCQYYNALILAKNLDEYLEII